MSAGSLAAAELQELEARVQEALRCGDEAGLRVLGHGEISLVLGWPPDAPAFACKRLPPFPDRGRFEAYRSTLVDYMENLRRAGTIPVPTSLEAVDRADGTVAGYAVQPALDPGLLAPSLLRDADPNAGHPLVAAVVDAAAATAAPRVGIDAQLSNWLWTDGELRYLDVTTPMLWDDRGRPRLDLDLLVQPLPAPMRPVVKRFLAPRILDGYRDLRGVYSDLCGNLIKERLQSWIPGFLAQVNRHLGPPMSESDVERYYRSDARLWRMLLAVRRFDRAWHRATRREYPFLLPGRVER